MRFYDDGSFYDQYFAYGHEFGTTHVIRCDNESDAYYIAIDESPTIEWEEIPEAYGFYFMQAKSCFAPDNGEPWHILCDTNFHGRDSQWLDNHKARMVSESVLKCTGDRLCIGEPFATKKEAIEFALEFIREHELDLIEGYQYQSNSTGTGIVDEGHYCWLREANADEIVAFKQAIPDESDE
jgi:hypothetical protein